MAEPFMGQIVTVGFNFAPVGYALCNGQLQSIAQNSALFSLLGTTFGGDGQVTFGLPDLRGRAALAQGQGPGLGPYEMGESSGQTNVTLIQTEMPMHNHMVMANNLNADTAAPTGAYYATESSVGGTLYSTNPPNTTMNPQMLTLAGGNQPHNNMQPYLVINFCIALEGIYPSRN